MVSALGLLLVFRTNSAYQRFVEGRKIWKRIINSSRDLYRMCMLYEQEMGLEKRRRMQRLLAAFPYLLRHRIRPNLVMRRVDDDQYPRDPENSILLYQDAAYFDTDPEAAALATEEEKLESRVANPDPCTGLTSAHYRGDCFLRGVWSSVHEHKIDHFGSSTAWPRNSGLFLMAPTLQHANDWR
jgi:hypothetical protein